MLNSPPGTAKIILLHIVTFGLYFLYWCSKSRQAIHNSAKQNLIPTTWLLIVPGLNYLWMWQYAHALELVSFRRLKSSETFLIFVLCTFLPLIIYYQASVFFPDYSDKDISEQAAKTIILITAGTFIGLWVIGHAIYCAVLQSKINKLRAK